MKQLVGYEYDENSSGHLVAYWPTQRGMHMFGEGLLS